MCGDILMLRDLAVMALVFATLASAGCKQTDIQLTSSFQRSNCDVFCERIVGRLRLENNSKQDICIPARYASGDIWFVDLRDDQTEFGDGFFKNGVSRTRVPSSGFERFLYVKYINESDVIRLRPGESLERTFSSQFDYKIPRYEKIYNYSTVSLKYCGEGPFVERVIRSPVKLNSASDILKSIFVDDH